MRTIRTTSKKISRKITKFWSNHFQFSVLYWCRVHRVHHKYADTEKDPTDINRGFLFAHIFWVFRHTSECKKALQTVDVNDLLTDKDVMFQYRYAKLVNKNVSRQDFF